VYQLIIRQCSIFYFTPFFTDSASDSDKRDLLGELDILVTVGQHENIISLVGACTKDGTVLCHQTVLAIVNITIVLSCDTQVIRYAKKQLLK